MNFIKNLAISFRLPAYSAMFCAWIAGLTAVGIFGDSEVAHRAITHISSGAFILMIISGAAPHHEEDADSQKNGPRR